VVRRDATRRPRDSRYRGRGHTVSTQTTKRDLEQAVRVINRRAGIVGDVWRRVCAPGCPVDDASVPEPKHHTLACRNVATVGAYYLDGAYGGWALYRVVSESGGVEDVFRCGHRAKRELYLMLEAFLDGWDHRDALAREETTMHP
jgi:hypothetical protein